MINETTCHVLAGGIGGTVAAVVTCPLEVIKVRLQSSGGRKFVDDRIKISTTGSSNVLLNLREHLRRFVVVRCFADIRRTEGFRGLYKGLTPTIFGVAPSRALYFTSYNKCQHLYSQYFEEQSSMLFVCSAITSSIIGSTITNPIWFIKTRLQLNPGNTGGVSGVFNLIRDIYQKGGIRVFYRGISASYVGSLETAINYAVYENIKAALLQRTHAGEAEKQRAREEEIKAKIDGLKSEGEALIDRQLAYHEYQKHKSMTAKWWNSVKEDTSSMDSQFTNMPSPQEFKSRVRKIEEDLNSLWNELDNLQDNHVNLNNFKGTQGGSKLQSTWDIRFCVFASVFAKFVAITIAYPHEVVRTRLREESGKYKGFLRTLVMMKQEEGWRSLYRGLIPHYIRQLPNQGIMLCSYELCMYLFQKNGLLAVKKAAE